MRKTQYISFDMRDISHIMYNIVPSIPSNVAPKIASLSIEILQFTNLTLLCAVS